MDHTSHEMQIKIGVSGAAETGHCGIDAYDKGLELGREIARHKAVLVTGATTGFPLWATVGFKEVGGFSVGFSPANTEKERISTDKDSDIGDGQGLLDPRQGLLDGGNRQDAGIRTDSQGRPEYT